MYIHTMMNSGKSAMKAKAVAEPKSELHMDVNILAPVALKIPSIPYAVRKARKGDARSSHLTIWERSARTLRQTLVDHEPGKS
jgi:hypothetical protein